jgi:hypothetical protein
MTHVLPRNGPINVPITLGVDFFENGQLFDPYSIQPVRIYNSATGGTPLITITPDAYGVGQYRITWDAQATSTSLLPGIYYDEWEWTAQSGMSSHTQRYSFELTEEEDTGGGTTPPTTTTPETQEVGCRPKPTWIHRLGLQLVEDVGNGMGINLGWEEARTSDVDQQIHYNIYYSNTRFGVWTGGPDAITTARTVTINIPSGNAYYFAVKATEFDTDFDITDLTQVGTNAYQYPSSQTLLNDLPEEDDGYTISVDDVSGFPSNGELLIDTEIMRYSALDTVNNTFTIDPLDRAITQTTLAEHEAGTDVDLWYGIEDGNTIIRQGVADWLNQIPYKPDELGEYLVDEDGYRSVPEDHLTIKPPDENNIDFPGYDFCGYHRPSLQDTFKGECVNSYVGGEHGGYRGLDFQDRNLARLDVLLQVTGEPIILLRRKWTGKRCKCISLRREHQRTRCGSCFGTGFDGGYDRYVNPRAVSEEWTNTQGYIMIRYYPYIDDLKIEDSQGLTQTSDPSSWTLAVPTIKDRDIIIRFNEDGTEEFRYECLNVTRNKLFFGQTGKQEFKALRMDKTDVIYQFLLTTLV